MKITEVRVFHVGEEKLKAYASIVIDDCFIVNDLKVIEGRSGLFVSMPSRRRKRGGYRDVAHPLNSETRQMVESRVLAEYERGAEPDEPLHVRPLDSDPTTEEPAAASDEPTVGAGDDDSKTLEEVEQHHLRDSFWTVP